MIEKNFDYRIVARFYCIKKGGSCEGSFDPCSVPKQNLHDRLMTHSNAGKVSQSRLKSGGVAKLWDNTRTNFWPVSMASRLIGSTSVGGLGVLIQVRMRRYSVVLNDREEFSNFGLSLDPAANDRLVPIGGSCVKISVACSLWFLAEFGT